MRKKNGKRNGISRKLSQDARWPILNIEWRYYIRRTIASPIDRDFPHIILAHARTRSEGNKKNSAE